MVGTAMLGLHGVLRPYTDCPAVPTSQPQWATGDARSLGWSVLFGSCPWGPVFHCSKGASTELRRRLGCSWPGLWRTDAQDPFRTWWGRVSSKEGTASGGTGKW